MFIDDDCAGVTALRGFAGLFLDAHISAALHAFFAVIFKIFFAGSAFAAGIDQTSNADQIADFVRFYVFADA